MRWRGIVLALTVSACGSDGSGVSVDVVFQAAFPKIDVRTIDLSCRTTNGDRRLNTTVVLNPDRWEEGFLTREIEFVVSGFAPSPAGSLEQWTCESGAQSPRTCLEGPVIGTACSTGSDCGASGLCGNRYDCQGTTEPFAVSEDEPAEPVNMNIDCEDRLGDDLLISPEINACPVPEDIIVFPIRTYVGGDPVSAWIVKATDLERNEIMVQWTIDPPSLGTFGGTCAPPVGGVGDPENNPDSTVLQTDFECCRPGFGSILLEIGDNNGCEFDDNQSFEFDVECVPSP